MNAAAFIREMCGGVKTGVSTDGARLGSDWLERPETGLPDRTGEGVDRVTSKLCAGVQKLNCSVPSQSMDCSG